LVRIASRIGTARVPRQVQSLDEYLLSKQTVEAAA
jgi:hypothetical protein